MKRFIVFCGMHYEEQGGMNDYLGTCDSVIEVNDLIQSHQQTEDWNVTNWYNGIDLKEDTVFHYSTKDKEFITSELKDHIKSCPSEIFTREN